MRPCGTVLSRPRGHRSSRVKEVRVRPPLGARVRRSTTPRADTFHPGPRVRAWSRTPGRPTTTASPPTSRGRRGIVRELVRLRGFQHLLVVRWPSQAADGMFQVAAASLLLFALDPFEQTSAWAIAQVIAITTLPFTVAGPLAGVFIDRWLRQRVLVWSNLLRIAVVLIGLPLASRFALGPVVGADRLLRLACSSRCPSTGSSSPRSGRCCRGSCRARRSCPATPSRPPAGR